MGKKKRRGRKGKGNHAATFIQIMPKNSLTSKFKSQPKSFEQIDVYY